MQGAAIDRAADAMEDLVNANRQLLDANTKEQVAKEYLSLNVDQKRVVDKVTNAVKSPNKTAPLRMIVSGFGGTGKSVVIKVIRNILCHHFSKDKCPVIVMAPIGLAAYSIKGETIHRCFSLPVDQAGASKYSELYTEQLLTLRAILQKTHLFIIDEISMVSALAFM